MAAPGGRARGCGLELKREGGRVELRRSLDFPVSRGYFGLIESVGPTGLRLRAGAVAIEADWRRGGRESGLLEGSFDFPLVVRSRKPGDALPLATGSKPLDEALGEWGVPEDLKDRIPVIEDRRGIVAVLASATGGRDRFRPLPTAFEEAGRQGLRIVVKGA